MHTIFMRERQPYLTGYHASAERIGLMIVRTQKPL
jgi:hypothetical protein